MTDVERRLLVLTDGDWKHSSSRLRAAAYIPLLEAAGYRVTWVARVGEAPRSPLGRVRFAVQKRWRAWRMNRLLDGNWDLVLVQRQHLPEKALGVLARRGIPMVYDFDDALYLDAPGQVTRATATARMVEAAAEVVVAAPALQPFCAAHGRDATVIPTPVDTDRIRPAAHPPEAFTVGWIGSSWTTPYLALLAEPLRDLAATLPLRVLLVGADVAQVRLPGVEVECVPWSHETEAVHLARMTVGVMPLPDEPFTRGKGAFKLYQYMAAGLPVVASPIGLNVQVVTPDVGFLAESAIAWQDALRVLIGDAPLRRRMGAAGRARAEQAYSRTVCGQQLQNVLGRALHKTV